MKLLVVARNTQRVGLATGLTDGCQERRTVAIADQTVGRGLVGLDKLIAGREHRHARPTVGLDLADTQSGQQP